MIHVEIEKLSDHELIELQKLIQYELWKREHPNLSELNLTGCRGEDSKRIKNKFKEYGLKIPKSIIYSYLVERDSNNNRELNILEYTLEIAKSFYNNINKTYIITLQEREKGAQGSYYYVDNYTLYLLNKETLEWIIYKMLTTNSTNVINILPQVLSPIKPVKIISLSDDYSSFGGAFYRKWISIYEVTIPYLVYSVKRNGPNTKTIYESRIVTETPETIDVISILRKNAYPLNINRYLSVHDKAGLLQKYKHEQLLVYEIGYTNENLYGDDFKELYIITPDNQIYKALVEQRISLSAEIGYHQEYLNRLVIYNQI
jgi:hypothetical protein